MWVAIGRMATRQAYANKTAIVSKMVAKNPEAEPRVPPDSFSPAAMVRSWSCWSVIESHSSLMGRHCT